MQPVPAQSRRPRASANGQTHALASPAWPVSPMTHGCINRDAPAGRLAAYGALLGRRSGRVFH